MFFSAKRTKCPEEIMATVAYGQPIFEIPEQLKTVYVSAWHLTHSKKDDDDLAKERNSFNTAMTNHRRRHCWIYFAVSHSEYNTNTK